MTQAAIPTVAERDWARGWQGPTCGRTVLSLSGHVHALLRGAEGGVNCWGEGRWRTVMSQAQTGYVGCPAETKFIVQDVG